MNFEAIRLKIRLNYVVVRDVPKQKSREPLAIIAKGSLHDTQGIQQIMMADNIGNASLDVYSRCDAEQLRLLVELLRLC